MAFKDLNRRRFASSIGPKEGKDFALFDMKINASNGMDIAVVLCEACNGDN